MALNTSAQKQLKGTVLKMAVHFDYPADSNIRLEDIDWYTEWYTSGKKIRIDKADHLYEDGVFYAFVDTAKTGTGIIKMRLWADIPDADLPSGVRPDYAEITTDIVIS